MTSRGATAQKEVTASVSNARRLQPWHYLAGLNLVFLAVAIGAVMIHRHPPLDSVFGIMYGFGPVVRAIVVEHRFGMREVHDGYWAYANRLPLIPLLLALLTILFHSFNAVFLVKNAAFSLFVLFAAVKLSLTPLKTIALVASIYFLPMHVALVTEIDVEEGYLFFFVISLGAILFTRQKSGYLAIGLLVAAVYLTKSSMVGFCFAAVVAVPVQDAICHGLRPRSLLPVLLLLLAVGSWGAFIYRATGVFAFGANASSWNGWNFYKGNNATAVRYYPRINLDQLDSNQSLDPPPTISMANEWERHRWQLEMGRKFIAEHPRDVFRMDLRKLAVFLYDVGETPRMYLPTHLLRITLILDHAMVALAILLACRRRDQASIVFAVLVASYLCPYLAGFLYQRHLVPVYGLAYCFVLHCWQSMDGESGPIARRVHAFDAWVNRAFGVTARLRSWNH